MNNMEENMFNIRMTTSGAVVLPVDIMQFLTPTFVVSTLGGVLFLMSKTQHDALEQSWRESLTHVGKSTIRHFYAGMGEYNQEPNEPFDMKPYMKKMTLDESVEQQLILVRTRYDCRLLRQELWEDIQKEPAKQKALLEMPLEEIIALVESHLAWRKDISCRNYFLSSKNYIRK